MNLEEKCKILFSVCGECLERHTEMRELDREPDFFKEVKPYADKYHSMLDEWAEESYAWIKVAKPKYVHPSQIDTLTDGMKQFIVQSFYKKTGLKRFVLSIRSAEYTLKTFLDALEEERERVMTQHPTINSVLNKLVQIHHFRKILSTIGKLKVRPRVCGISTVLHPSIIKALKSKGIEQLYSHQREAFDNAYNGESFTAVTPTASGKSLCYHLPVLQSILEDESSRAIYLFPTKALAQDQLSDLHELIEASEETILSYTYDGDTAPGLRSKVRKSGHIVLTNPDMLHSGILPHHTKWVSLFENLKYIIIDELHTYKGVFGSHVAHVLRRLKRICNYYGSDPVFICTSATIANPGELAESLTNTKMRLISNNGAPAGKKHFIFYNPPVVHPTFGIRRSAVLEVRDIASLLYREGIQTIVFAKSRVRVEMLVTYLQDLTKKKLFDDSVMGYRGGYLPSERRKIEKGLRDGTIKTVVSTNALELGIDIGQLQACIMTGYPGNIASAFQQAGRAGRRQEDALIIYVAQSVALDQYIIENPDYLLGQSPEEGRIHPDNMFILMDHLKCASFELPFSMTETYGEFEVQELLEFLEAEGVLFKTSDRWHWMTDRFPASDVSLRSAAQENVVIIDKTIPKGTVVIGEMDRFSAMTLLHEEAIYIHQGTQYQVEKLDWEEKKAYVTEVDVDYFTDANLAVELKVMNEDESSQRKMVLVPMETLLFLRSLRFLKKFDLVRMITLVLVQFQYQRLNFIHHRHGIRLMFRKDGQNRN